MTMLSKCKTLEEQSTLLPEQPIKLVLLVTFASSLNHESSHIAQRTY